MRDFRVLTHLRHHPSGTLAKPNFSHVVGSHLKARKTLAWILVGTGLSHPRVVRSAGIVVGTMTDWLREHEPACVTPRFGVHTAQKATIVSIRRNTPKHNRPRSAFCFEFHQPTSGEGDEKIENFVTSVNFVGAGAILSGCGLANGFGHVSAEFAGR
jgi:hypothetical protein